jgi:hypothetical protein
LAQRQQKIFALNEVAAYIAGRLADGARLAVLSDELCERGIAEADARRFVRQLFGMLGQERLLVADVPSSPAAPMHVQHIEVAGFAAILRYHEASLADRVAPAFAHLVNASRSPCESYDLFRTEEFVLVKCGSAREAFVFTQEQAAPALKGFLTDHMLSAADDSIALHAACLVKNGRGLLVIGTPGAGKTTLTLGLSEAGFGYGGDDIAFLHADGSVEGAAFPMALKPGSWELARACAPGREAAPVHRRLDGKRVRYLPPASSPHGAAVRPKWLVIPRRRKSGPATLNAIEPAQALSEILRDAHSSTHGVTERQFRALLDLVGGVDLHELHYSELGDAVDAITRLCSRA